MTRETRPTAAGSSHGPVGFRDAWTKWGAILGAWMILSLFFAPEVYLYFVYKDEPIPWSQTFALTFVNAVIAAAFTPAIVWLTRRFPFDRRRWPRSLLVHVPACLAFSVGHSWLYSMACYASPALFHQLFARFHPNLLTYWAIVGFTEAITYFEKYQERERELARAQLQLLKMQLHPHFLFNTLHTISAMMHEDVSSADRMIARLSDLLRMTLDNIGHQEVALKQEIEFLQKYLEIERMRFQDKLAVMIDVGPDVLDARLPSMILQPLVENSIRHGFGSHRSSGEITIHAHRHDGMLVVRVVDNGCGISSGPSRPMREGLGIGNTRQRLEQLYPERHRFLIENVAAGGARVTVEIPYQTVSPEEPTPAQ